MVYKLKKIVGTNNFSAQNIKTILIINRPVITLNIATTACLVVNSNTVGNFALIVRRRVKPQTL